MSALSPSPLESDPTQLIEQHRSFVRALAVEIARGLPPYIELEELVACGNLGLVEAARRYDPRYRTNFRTFAYYRIRGAIYDAIRGMGPLSRGEYARARFNTNANDLLRTIADDERSSLQNTAQTLDDEIANAQAVIDALIPIYLLSLDSEQLPEVADGRPTVLSEIEEAELAGLTRSMVERLGPEDRGIIEEVYFKNRTISRVAADLGISKSWASRLHSRAVRHLRELMEEHGLLDSSVTPSAVSSDSGS